MTLNRKQFWDHSTKPSMFVEVENGVEVYRGPFKEVKARDFYKEIEELRRERDEAREAAAKWESSFDAMERAGAEQARRADENREWALRAERERDEAREERDRYKRMWSESRMETVEAAK